MPLNGAQNPVDCVFDQVEAERRLDDQTGAVEFWREGDALTLTECRESFFESPQIVFAEPDAGKENRLGEEADGKRERVDE